MDSRHGRIDYFVSIVKKQLSLQSFTEHKKQESDLLRKLQAVFLGLFVRFEHRKVVAEPPHLMKL